MSEIGLDADRLAQLVKMLSSGEINATAAAKIFDLTVESSQTPREIAEAESLLSVTDISQLDAWVDEAISANPKAVEDVRSDGKQRKKAFGFLMGQVMQKSRGAAPPPEVQRLLQEKLG